MSINTKPDPRISADDVVIHVQINRQPLPEASLSTYLPPELGVSAQHLVVHVEIAE